MAKAKATKPEMAKYGLLEFLSAKLGNFKASDYGAVQRAVKLAEIIDRALLEANPKRVEVFAKHGFKPGESVTDEYPNLQDLSADLDAIANEDSSVSIAELRMFTSEEFERDAIREGGLDYRDAGVLGKWLVKE